MENSIALAWKSFPVKVDKIQASLKTLLSSNFDGLVCDPDNLRVMFKAPISDDDVTAVTTYWTNILASAFNPTLQEIISGKINDAIVFGNNLVTTVAIENVTMGVTQANKTKLVSDYCRTVARYLREGSLYAAMGELDSLIAEGPPAELAPFVTVTRLIDCKSKITTFLGI